MATMLPASEPVYASWTVEQKRRLVQGARDRVAKYRAAWADKFATIGALPPCTIVPCADTDVSRMSAACCLDEYHRTVAAWKLEKKAWESRWVEVAAGNKKRKGAVKRRRLGDASSIASSPAYSSSAATDMCTDGSQQAAAVGSDEHLNAAVSQVLGAPEERPIPSRPDLRLRE